MSGYQWTDVDILWNLTSEKFTRKAIFWQFAKENFLFFWGVIYYEWNNKQEDHTIGWKNPQTQGSSVISFISPRMPLANVYLMFICFFVVVDGVIGKERELMGKDWQLFETEINSWSQLKRKNKLLSFWSRLVLVVADGTTWVENPPLHTILLVALCVSDKKCCHGDGGKCWLVYLNFCSSG